MVTETQDSPQKEGEIVKREGSCKLSKNKNLEPPKYSDEKERKNSIEARRTNLIGDLSSNA